MKSMLLESWERMPKQMRNSFVRPYYEILKKKRLELCIKRLFDIIFSIILIFLFFPLFLIIALLIKLDSNGSVLFIQKRVTCNYKLFKIFKFRTMFDNNGSLLTQEGDARITKIGAFLRKYHLDELPQLFNVLLGDMSFVGARPELPYYVDKYEPEMLATLLLPTGITSLTSVIYKDEEKLLAKYTDNLEETYIRKIIPDKMKYNLQSLRYFSLFNDFKVIIITILAVIGICKVKNNSQIILKQ